MVVISNTGIAMGCIARVHQKRFSQMPRFGMLVGIIRLLAKMPDVGAGSAGSTAAGGALPGPGLMISSEDGWGVIRGFNAQVRAGIGTMSDRKELKLSQSALR